MDLKLDSPVQFVPRVGPAMALKLDTLGIHTVYDLLTHIPFRYNDYSLVSKVARVQAGETVTLQVTIESIKNVFTKNGKRLQIAVVSDESGKMEVTWFNQIYLPKLLSSGDLVYLSGQVGWFGPKVVMLSPEYEKIASEGSTSLHSGRIVPVYSETAGVTSKWLRGRIAFLLEHTQEQLTETIPDDIRTERNLLGLEQAIIQIHFPDSLPRAAEARRRLAFEELFLLLMRGYEQKRTWQNEFKAPKLSLDPKLIHAFIQNLPFSLTDDQQSAISEILSDIAKSIPMNRLLEGDVGAGKTVVAAAAIYAAYANNTSAILLAPTQILAQQHHKTLTTLLSPYGIAVSLVIGSDKPKSTRDIGVYVGTHALLSEKLTYTDIGLVVIDEQQRFGVNQRTALQKTQSPHKSAHVLTMTATPIPRTIAHVMFGNLDLSILASMPKGRKIVKTWVVGPEKRENAYVWIAKELTTLRTQAFVVCPLIEESETLTAVKAVKSEFEHLKKVFSKHKVGLLHGRLTAKEKTDVLDAFRNKTIDILVSTPVVEVGIDIPNATIMVIEAADRFGLSQLHQLRGRVGRGSLDSYCLLFTENTNEIPLKRLKAMETTHNGPELAQLDLELRGPGELYGTAQHGIPNLKVASLTDHVLIAEAQKALAQAVKSDPALKRFTLLRQKLNLDKIESVQN